MFFRVSYPLYFKGKLQRTNYTNLFGFELTIPPTVFHPGLFFSTKILGKYLMKLRLSGSQILEMGSGSGLLSLIAAKEGARVTSVDINPVAVECTKANAARNNLTHMLTVIESDLFSGVAANARFDYIIWNPPFFPQEPEDEAAKAWKVGKGYRVLSRFAEQAGSYLSPGGRIIMPLSSQLKVEEIVHFFTGFGLQGTPVHKQRSFFETFTIYEFCKVGRLSGD